MASNNKREQEYKKRKRRENDQDSAPVTAARVLCAKRMAYSAAP